MSYPKTPHVRLLLLLLGAWIYFIFISLPMAGFLGLFGENQTPSTLSSFLYLIVTLPAFIGYVLIFLKNIGMTKKFNVLIWPLNFFSLPIFGLICMLSLGGTVLWFLLFLFPSFLFGIPLLTILGLKKDLKHKQSSPQKDK